VLSVIRRRDRRILYPIDDGEDEDISAEIQGLVRIVRWEL
jgi:hypothetical protein